MFLFRFLIRRVQWMLRLYTVLFLGAVIMVAIDYALQAKAAGPALGQYDRSAYLDTLQRRLRGQGALTLGADGRVSPSDDQVRSPLDLALMALRGLGVARLQILGLEGGADTVALLPQAQTPTVPRSAQPSFAPPSVGQSSGADDDDTRPCVRRGNVLEC